MFISGAKAKEELATNSRVVGSNGNIKVVFSGGELEGSSGVDAINLPDIPANAQVDNTKMRELRGLADHEAFHIRYTPLDRWAEIAEYVQASGDGISMGVLNGAEDVRIERLGMREFPGTKRNLQATVNRALDLQAEQAKHADPDKWVAFMPLVLTWLGRDDNGMDMVLPASLAHFADKFSGLDLSVLYQPDSFDGLLTAVADYLNDVWQVSTLRNFLDGKAIENKPKPKNEKKNKESGDKSRKNNQNRGSGFECKPPANKGVKKKSIEVLGEKHTNGVPSIHLTQIVNDLVCDFPYFGNEELIAYEDIEPLLSSDNQPMDWLSSSYGLGEGLVQALKDQITKRNAAGRVVNLLDHRKLINAYNRQDKIWKNKKELERGFNTAVSFVVDWSSSIHGLHRELLAITTSLSRGIAQAGLPLEITGFTELPTRYTLKEKCVRSGQLNIYTAKSFDQPLDYRRIAGMQESPMGFTPDTEALQLAVERIGKRLEKRKVVIILTDGGSQPAHTRTISYNGQKCLNIREIYNAHQISVLRQAEQDGIEVYAIALGRHDMVNFKEDRVLRVKNIKELESRIFKLFFDVIARKGQ